MITNISDIASESGQTGDCLNSREIHSRNPKAKTFHQRFISGLSPEIFHMALDCDLKSHNSVFLCQSLFQMPLNPIERQLRGLSIDRAGKSIGLNLMWRRMRAVVTEYETV
jgi:hypothetical protein